MTQEVLINEIRIAFKEVTLEDGIGLWEAQGIDDYADDKTIRELKKKDERHNWSNISYKDLEACASSLSFFDAKGMIFHLPQFLIFDILEGPNICVPDVQFTLTYNLEGAHQQKIFSLLNNQQRQCIIHYFEYRLQEVIQQYEEYKSNYNTSMNAIYSDAEYKRLNEAIDVWKQKKY